MRPRARGPFPIARLVWSLVLAIALAVILGACTGAPKPSVTWPPDAIVVTADRLAFDTTELVFPADTESTFVLRNLETQPHNVAITTERAGAGELLFRHDLVTAKTEVYTVPAMPNGVYFFRCEAHPTMSGTVIVR